MLSFPKASGSARGLTYPYISVGKGVAFFGVKRPEHETDHSSSAEVKNECLNHCSTPFYSFLVHTAVTSLFKMQKSWFLRTDKLP